MTTTNEHPELGEWCHHPATGCAECPRADSDCPGFGPTIFDHVTGGRAWIDGKITELDVKVSDDGTISYKPQGEDCEP